MTTIWYSFFISDYAKATSDLSMIEDGAYRRLLDYYYLNEGGFIDDKKRIYCVCRAFSRSEKQAIVLILERFFIKVVEERSENGRKTVTKWTHKRAEKELETIREKSAKARASANARWKKENKDDANADANAMLHHTHTHKEGVSITPTPSLDAEKEKEKEGAKKINLLGGVGVGNGDIDRGSRKLVEALSQDALSELKIYAPSWNLYKLMKVYVQGIEKRGGFPRDLNKAFPKWALAYTKGVPPN
jgi:uncharacterized protein YdaU (DUF1376 family)